MGKIKKYGVGWGVKQGVGGGNCFVFFFFFFFFFFFLHWRERARFQRQELRGDFQAMAISSLFPSLHSVLVSFSGEGFFVVCAGSRTAISEEIFGSAFSG